MANSPEYAPLSAAEHEWIAAHVAHGRALGADPADASAIGELFDSSVATIADGRQPAADANTIVNVVAVLLGEHLRGTAGLDWAIITDERTDMTDIRITRNEAESRWEARLDDTLAGFAQYQLATELIVFTHTEVDPAFEGRGVGGALARAALDAVRTEGDRKVLIVCPFITGWIGRHREYADLLYGAPRSTAKD